MHVCNRETMGLFASIRIMCTCILLVFSTSIDGSQYIGRIFPGFEGSQKDYIDDRGLFLRSNSSAFAFGFYLTLDAKSFVLVILHLRSNRIVWTANRGLPVRNSDKFVFNNNGNVYLEHPGGQVWSTLTEGKKPTALELQDTGNLVLLDKRRKILWQSFSHPTDTLLPGQVFSEGMLLRSFPKDNSLFHYLEIKSGDMILYVGYQTPQLYWSMANDGRKHIRQGGGWVTSASLTNNSWSLYDQKGEMIWQFVFSENSETNDTWAAVLGADGSISFLNLLKGKSGSAAASKIPADSCAIPEPCHPFYVCSFNNHCQCPPSLISGLKCKPPIYSACSSSKTSAKLVYLGEKLNYFALAFISPFIKTDLEGCKSACHSNCSCFVLFFENTSGSCFLFDHIGSLQRSDPDSNGFISYVKVTGNADESVGPNEKSIDASAKHAILLVVITVVTLVVIFGLLYLGSQFLRKRKTTMESYVDTSEEDDLFGSFSGMPIRYRFSDLHDATRSFSTKLGRGGFGSVYHGLLPEGTQVAVKKLDHVGQGKKEFRAEVSIIGSVHHVHLVKLRGFCAEGTHRLLVYEYMGKGSLDRWIFKNDKENPILDWDRRFNIAVGTAKGLAYLHEECNVKIVHCDIKPENVLLDDNFHAKVSDFGLAKLMNREQGMVFTTLRGTRGYLAPEWIKNHAISEKSDVYSFGIVLLEIISGRRSYEADESPKRSYYPSFAFEMMEEGKVEEILDPRLRVVAIDDRVITAVKVALWCIQDDMNLRPSMTKVVQMLEGLCPVPYLPSSFKSSCLSTAVLQSTSKQGTSLGSIEYDSPAHLSDIYLSGPR